VKIQIVETCNHFGRYPKYAVIYCPACECLHRARLTHFLDPKNVWEYNGNPESPSLSPSCRLVTGDKECCHFTLEDGVLIYDKDSTHELAGKNVDLPDIPPEMVR